MTTLLSRIDEFLAAVFRYAVILSMALITVVVFVQVVFRYVLDLPLSWSEEVARFGFVWLVFLGAGLLTRMADHIWVTSFIEAFPPRLRNVLAAVVEASIVFCGVIYFVGGMRIARNEWSQLSPAIEAQMGIIYTVIPLSAAFIILWSPGPVHPRHPRTANPDNAMTTLFLLVAPFLGTLIIGIPIGVFALTISALVMLWHSDLFAPELVVQRMFAGLDSFPMMAIPFFMLAGSLMEQGGISTRLVRFSNYLVGWITGGLAHVSILASIFFAGITGSSVAETTAIGSTMLPIMKQRGFPPTFSASVHRGGRRHRADHPRPASRP